ncbi:MAG: YncE family protein [Mycobacteriales bacterium]
MTRARRSLALLSLVGALAGCSANPTQVPGAAGPATGSPTSTSGRASSNRLFTIAKRLSFGSEGPNPSLVGIDSTSLFLTGAFTNSRGQRVTLVRVDRRTFTVAAGVYLAHTTDVTYGDGALWWASGAPNIETGCNCTPPPPSRLLLRIDPITLRVLARFALPAPPLLVAVAAGHLWVATPGWLFQLDPSDGRIVTQVGIGVNPVSLAPSPDGTLLYVLGDSRGVHFTLAAYDSTTGRRLGEVTGSAASGGPLAPTSSGVWVPEFDLSAAPSASIHLFRGPGLAAGPVITGTANDAQPYALEGSLWLIDGAGQAPTICSNPETGAPRLTGPPVGIELGAVIGDSHGTYLVENFGTHDSLLQIGPNPRC